MTKNDWKENVDDQIEKLKSSDLETRQQAAWELHKLAEDNIDETKKAIPVLLRTIKDDDWVVRKMSTLALGELGVNEAIPMIIDFLKFDVEPEVRAGAAEALGDLRAEQAVPSLIDALDDSADIVRQVSIWSLGLIGEKAKKAVPKILEFLSRPEDIGIVQISHLAAWALGEIGDKSAIDPLVNALNNAAYHEKQFNIAYSLALLEDSIGFGFTELQRMKENHELDNSELELFEKLMKKKN